MMRTRKKYFYSFAVFLIPYIASERFPVQIIPLLEQNNEESGTGMTCLITSVILIAIIVWLYKIGSREQRKKAILEIRQKLPEYIREHYGSIRLSQVARQWKLEPKWAQPVLDEMAPSLRAHILDLPDGDRLYEFPDFMRSETDFAAQLRELHETEEKGFTVEDAAKHLKKTEQQTQVILDQLLAKGLLIADKKRKKIFYKLKDLSDGNAE